MRSTIIIFFLLVPMLLSPNLANAVAFESFECINCATNLVTDRSSLITSVKTTLSAATEIKQLGISEIVIPALNAAAAKIINQLQKDTINWIRTGFKGGGPAYIVNRDAYFKNIANREIEIQLLNIQNQNSIFSNSVIGTAIQSVRTGRAPTSQQIKYTLGQTIQQTVCTDANLTAMATQAVNGGGLVATLNNNRSASRQQQIAERKKALSDQLCSKSAFNQASLERNLATCFATNFNCGGWGAWLDLTTNPNNTAYGQNTLASGLIANQVLQKQTQAQQEMVNGIMPKKKCVEYMKNDDEGNPYPQDIAPCIKEEVEIPAQSIVAQLNAAINAPIIRTANAQSPGGLAGMVQNLLTAGIVKLFSQAVSSSGRGVNSNGITNINVNGNRIVPIGTGGYGPDLQSGATTSPNEELSTSPAQTFITRLRAHQTSLINAQPTLQASIKLYADYAQDITTLEQCYTTLATIHPELANGSPIQDGRQYISDVRTDIATTSTQLQEVLLKITNSKTVVAGYIAVLNNNPSDSQVTNTYSDYITKVSDGTILDDTQDTLAKNQNEILTQKISTDRTNNLTPRLSQCRGLGGS